MKFYVGLHHPGDAKHVERAFISAHALRKRRSPIEANEWIMDSGAFTTLLLHGHYVSPASDYADLVRRFISPNLVAVVTQDYMCEPSMVALTGLSIPEHQRLTIERYDEIIAAKPGAYVMPVLQGYEPEQYALHVRQYGDRLAEGAWVGVGSVCKRNASWVAVRDVLEAILAERPDLKLHGFGVKTTSLAYAAVRDKLYSADSMAWSFAARYEGRNRNDWREAQRFARRVNAQTPQLDLDLGRPVQQPA